ncbi:MAG TPA: hypothetical protein VKU60_05380, partial [Chloroflexota bacterium]|nr:hypothetical protein [Chloroflexota bacterium]
LESGQIQAAVVTSPNNLLVRQAGFHQIVDLIPLKLHTVTQGIFVRDDWAKQNQPTILNFLKAYLESVKVDKTDAAAAQASVSKWTGIQDQALVAESYRATLGGLASFPLAEDQDFQNVLDLTDDPALKSRKPADFYDNSYLQSLESFARTLYPDGIPAT